MFTLREHSNKMNMKTEFNIGAFTSREERHYCAYLYSWLLESRENVENLLPEGCEIGKDYRLFYEYTAIREYLYSIKKKDKPAYKKEKEFLNQQLVNFENPNPDQKNDIQKKKIDLAIQTQLKGKTMVYLIEAKFEGSFDIDQLKLTENYGKILKDRFDAEYRVILLGMEYHLMKDGLDKYKQVSWEELNDEIDNPEVKEEIKNGLDYQYKIHPKTKFDK